MTPESKRATFSEPSQVSDQIQLIKLARLRAAFLRSEGKQLNLIAAAVQAFIMNRNSRAEIIQTQTSVKMVVNGKVYEIV